MIPYVGKDGVENVLTPREKLIVVLPLIAGVVIVLVYFGLFANPLIIAVIFVLWVAVSLRNKRKFDKERDGNRGKAVSKVSALDSSFQSRLTQPFQSPSLAPWVLTMWSFKSRSFSAAKPQ